MGFRQPSQVSAMFAQIKSGAEQQKRARDKLKTPTALGGAATAGTGMIASKTKAQNEATEQVKDTTAQAQKELTAENVGTNTVSMIAGEPNKGPSLPNVSSIPTVQKAASGASGDIGNVKASEQVIDFNIKTIEDQISKLDDDLKDANAADVAAIEAERTRLTNLLTDYQKQLTEGNLGQIAGPSALETRLSEREQLLAAEDPYLADGTDTSIAKLSSILGPRWKSKSAASKALASQVYGKDLETLGEQAAAGLREQELSKEQSDQAIEGFSDTLSERKKEYEKSLDRQTEQVDILNKSPGELKTYTRSKIEEIFGKDTANKLFMFSSDDPNATVTDTVSSKTRTILSDALKLQKDEKDKIKGELESAEKINKQLFDQDTSLVVQQFNDWSDPNDTRSPDFILEQVPSALRQIQEKNNSFFGGWSGISKDSAIIKEVGSLGTQLSNLISEYQTIIDEARNTGNRQAVNDAGAKYIVQIEDLRRRILDKYEELTPDGQDIMRVGRV